MNRWILNAIGLSIVGALSLAGWAFYQFGSAARAVTPQASTLLQRWTPAGGKANALIDATYNFIHNTNEAVNRPCGSGHPCGLLAQTGKTIVKAGDAVVTTQMVERQTAAETVTAVRSFRDAAQHVQTAVDASTGLLNASTVAVNRLPALEDASTETVRNFNRLISSKSLSDAIDGAAGMTQHGNAILGDAQKVADKVTADYLKPVPWYMQPVKRVGQLWDIGAAVARHTP